LPEWKKEAFVVVTDNAANMLNAVKRLEYTHLWYVSNSFYYYLSVAQKGFLQLRSAYSTASNKRLLE
jgi:hypothetical protein